MGEIFPLSQEKDTSCVEDYSAGDPRSINSNIQPSGSTLMLRHCREREEGCCHRCG